MRTYRSRGWVVQCDQPGVCPLSHISSKSITALLDYGAGNNHNHYVQLARAVLHTDTLETVDSLNTLLHRVDPTSPTQLQGPAYVEEHWDCTEHLHYLQSILQLPSRVEVLAHYHIGSYVNALAASTQQKLDAITRICNAAQRKQVEEYRTMMTTCNCSKCRAEMEWIGNPQRPHTRPMPCNLVQVQCKLHHKSFVNVTPPFFRQCVAFSASVPARSPSLLCTQHTGATVRSLLPDLASKVAAMERRAHLPCSPSSLGLTSVFRVPTDAAIEVLHYTDGDGGYLQVSDVHVLHTYSTVDTVKGFLSTHQHTSIAISHSLYTCAF